MRFNSAYTEREVRLGGYVAAGLWLMVAGVLAVLAVWSTAMPTAI